MKKLLIVLMLAMCIGCTQTVKQIVVDGRTISKSDLAQVNAMRMSKVSWEATQDAVIRIESQQLAAGYATISKDKFDKFDDLDFKLVKTQNLYARAYIDYLHDKEPKQTLIKYGNLLLKYQAEIASLLRDFGVLK